MEYERSTMQRRSRESFTELQMKDEDDHMCVSDNNCMNHVKEVLSPP